MIDDVKLQAWLAVLQEGGRINGMHRAEQRELIEEVLTHRGKVREFNEKMRVILAQNQALQETLSILQKRGEKNGGVVVSTAPPITAKHGDVIPLPDDGSIGGSCDWGGCDKQSNHLRFDAFGHGWLPVCDECAVKPLDV